MPADKIVSIGGLMKKLLFSLLFTTACGNAGQGRIFFDKEVEDMTVEFQKATGVPMDRSIEITLVDFLEDISPEKGEVVGLCITSDIEEPKVQLLREHWINASFYAKRAVLFHELGHCFLDLDHDETLLPNGIPRSLMYPSTISELIYEPWEEYYLYELKQKGH
jgi:hypothetical protein